MDNPLTLDVVSRIRTAPYEVSLGSLEDRYRHWLALYHYLFGKLPRVVPVGGQDPQEGHPLRAFVCDHPIFRDHIALGAASTWSHSDRLVGHMQNLGFQAWNCQCYNQIPTVETYMTLHRRHVGAEFGFDLEFSEAPRHRLKFFDWLDWCFKNVFVVHLTTPEFFDQLALEQPTGPMFEKNARLIPHVIEVVHDLSQHIPNYHYMPKELLSALAERFQDAMSDADFLASMRKKPGPLAGFYDNDINVFCYAVWARIDDPHDFPNVASEPNNVKQLFAIADLRIEETRQAGLTKKARRVHFELASSHVPHRQGLPAREVHPILVPPAQQGEAAEKAVVGLLSPPKDGEPPEPSGWKPELSVGNKAMDAQHKQWLQILADLRAALERGEGETAVSGTFDRMVEYTQVHFAAEERLMRDAGFEGLANHMAQHEAFVSQLHAMRKDGGKLDLSMAVLDLLVGWLLSHIQGADQGYNGHI